MLRLSRLNLISVPPQEAFDSALYQLRCLDALMPADEKGRVRLSEMGTRLAAFPLDPPYARYFLINFIYFDLFGFLKKFLLNNFERMFFFQILFL